MLQAGINKLKTLFTKKNLFYIFLFLGVFFLLKDFSFADGSTTNDSNDFWHKIAEVIDVFLRIFSALLAVLSSLVALLLSPKWVNGSVIGLHVYLKEIWILVSNVVYFIFAFLIIVIALMNIVGKGGDGPYQLKTAIPKFIVGILLVPFSWFIVQFILSISAVLTVSVLTIPYETFQGYKAYENKYLQDYKMCTKYKLNLSSSGTTQQGNSDQNLSKYDIGDVLECTGGEMTIDDFLAGESGYEDNIYGIIYLYTYVILNPAKSDDFKSDEVVNLESFLRVIQTVIFDIIFIVIYLILLATLFIALMVRIFWLWLYIMASPAIGLGYFFGKSNGGGDGALSKFKISEVMHLAFVPVYVSLALSFGFLFLLVASTGIRDNKGLLNESILEDSTIKFAGFELDMKGVFSNSTDDKKDRFFGDAGSPIAALIIEIFGIAILWIAVLAALSKPETTKSVVEPIKKFGETVGQTAAKLPTYIPIMPGGLSAHGLSHAAQTTQGWIQSNENTKASKFATKHWGEQFGQKTEVQEAVDKVNSAVTAQQNLSSSRKLLASAGSAEKIAGDENIKKAIVKGFTEIQKSGYHDFNKEKMKKWGEDFLKTSSGAEIKQLLVDYENKAKPSWSPIGDDGVDITTVDEVNPALKNMGGDGGGDDTPSTGGDNGGNIFNITQDIVIKPNDVSGNAWRINEKITKDNIDEIKAGFDGLLSKGKIDGDDRVQTLNMLRSQYGNGKNKKLIEELIAKFSNNSSGNSGNQTPPASE